MTPHMEATDGPGAIRPLPPDLPVSGPGGGPSPAPPERRWVPLLVAAGALVVFGVLAGIFGDTRTPTPGEGRTETTAPALGGQALPPTTTSTLPPTLGEIVPDLQRDLSIVYRNQAGTSTSEVIWRRESSEPGEPLNSAAAARQATFDVSRQALMWVTPGRRDTLWVGRPPVAEPVFIDVSGAAWHASTPQALAWIGRPTGTDVAHLYRATVSPATGIDAAVDLGPTPERAELVAWGDWGFLLGAPAPLEHRRHQVENPSDPGSNVTLTLDFAILLDPIGEPVAVYAAAARAAGPAGHLVLQPATEAFELALAGGLDPESLGFGADLTPVDSGPDGEPVVVLAPDLAPTGVAFDPSSQSTVYAFTPDGSRVSAMGVVDTRFLVQTEVVDGSGRRITSIEDVDTYLGHSRDGGYVVLRNSTDGDIVLHDWNRGASFRIPFRLGTVLAVDA